MKYKVEAIVTRTYQFIIDADSPEEAIGKISLYHKDKDIYHGKWNYALKAENLYGVDVFDMNDNLIKGIHGGDDEI